MRTLLTVLAAACLTLASAAHATEKLAQTNGCLACHTMDKKVIGPSLKDIAAKYRANKGAEAELVKKVKAGGKGVWGEIPMPPNAHVKDEDIKSIVQWILSIK
jgi:cytochrome c